MRSSKFWFKNEKEVMKRLGFEPVKGSGSGWIDKEDGESDIALAQLKSTEAESYKINLLDIQKLEYHAYVSHKLPIFVIQFLNRGTYLLLNVERLNDLYYFLVTNKIDTKSNEIKIEEGVLRRKKVKSSNSERQKFYKERENKWKNRNRK